MNIRFDDSILQDFGDLCSTFFSSTPMFSIEPFSLDFERGYDIMPNRKGPYGQPLHGI